jgi:hypothetical protein
MTSQGVDLARAAWQKSSYSGSNGGQCVEVARNLRGFVAVRDSKDPGGPSLIVTAGEWQAFLDGVRPAGSGCTDRDRAYWVVTPSHRPSA